MPTDSRYLYKPTVGLSSRSARTLKKPATDRPADKRLEKGQETRRAIVETATRLFAERGYAAVSIETVLAACQISRGALYHHFASKEELLEAAFEAVEIDVTAKVLASAANASGAAAAVQAGCEAFLDLTQDPVVRQIMLTDAPSVLGWDKWREIDERHAFGLMKAALEPAAQEAGIPAALVDAFRAHAACLAFRDRPRDRRGGRCVLSAGERQGGCPRASGPHSRSPGLD